MSGKVIKVAGPLVVAEGLSDANVSDVVRVGPQQLMIIPISLFTLSLIFAFILALCYFVFYMVVTPSECLNPNQWQKFMSFFS